MPEPEYSSSNKPASPQIVLSKIAQNKYSAPSVGDIFQGLASTERRIVFELLCRQEAQIEDLQIYTLGHYQGLRRNLQVLEQYHLISSYKDGKYRYYHATQEPLINLYIWINSMQTRLTRLN